jgi:hypothetical protein
VDAKDAPVDADLRVPREAVRAAPARNHARYRDAVPGVPSRDPFPGLHDLPGEFMTEDDRLECGGSHSLVDDVDVGAAEPAGPDLQKDVAGSWPGLRNLFHHERAADTVESGGFH